MSVVEKLNSTQASGAEDMEMFGAVNGLAARVRVVIHHVKSHVGVTLNEDADVLADKGQEREWRSGGRDRHLFRHDNLPARI